MCIRDRFLGGLKCRSKNTWKKKGAANDYGSLCRWDNGGGRARNDLRARRIPVYRARRLRESLEIEGRESTRRGEGFGRHRTTSPGIGERQEAAEVVRRQRDSRKRAGPNSGLRRCDICLL